MQSKEVEGPVLEFFRSYLSYKRQYTTINNVDSDKQVMKHGVPQESVLGPTLFLIHNMRTTQY